MKNSEFFKEGISYTKIVFHMMRAVLAFVLVITLIIVSLDVLDIVTGNHTNYDWRVFAFGLLFICVEIFLYKLIGSGLKRLTKLNNEKSS